MIEKDRPFSTGEAEIGKRSSFKRIARDAYDTPPEAVIPLIPHLNNVIGYREPCAGRGALTDALAKLAPHLQLMGAWDIEPRRPDIGWRDALDHPWLPSRAIPFITNPPWDRAILHPLIERLSDVAACWLLFDASWVHTRQAARFAPRLRKVVSVGRVKWIAGTKMTGKDDCAWHLFTAPSEAPTQLFMRAAA